MPDLLTYYESLSKDEKGKLTKKIYIELDMPYITFRQKLVNNTFSPSEEIALSQITGFERNELFPITSKTA